jgi:hypothetical protein
MELPIGFLGTPAEVRRRLRRAIASWRRNAAPVSLGELTHCQPPVFLRYAERAPTTVGFHPTIAIDAIHPTNPVEIEAYREMLLGLDWGPWAILNDAGVLRSKRQLDRLLIWASKAFPATSDEILFQSGGHSHVTTIWQQTTVVLIHLVASGYPIAPDRLTIDSNVFRESLEAKCLSIRVPG